MQEFLRWLLAGVAFGAGFTLGAAFGLGKLADHIRKISAGHV